MIPLLEDCFFAAIAAIGFGSISNVPVKAFSGCAILAAAGHGTRYPAYGTVWRIHYLGESHRRTGYWFSFHSRINPLEGSR